MTRIATPGGSCFKTPAYRNRALLDLARLAPYCMACDAPNDGTVVAAHSNAARHGKGRSLKSGDQYIAFLCARCHHEVDQGSKWSRQDRVDLWEEAHMRTIGWLFESGYLVVAQPSDS
jgi:hypothetical protein